VGLYHSTIYTNNILKQLHSELTKPKHWA